MHGIIGIFEDFHHFAVVVQFVHNHHCFTLVCRDCDDVGVLCETATSLALLNWVGGGLVCCRTALTPSLSTLADFWSSLRAVASVAVMMSL